MKTKEIIGCINYRVEFLNKKFGLDIHLEKNRYGYNLYIPNGNGGHTTGGTMIVHDAIDRSRSASEMLAYLDGIMALWSDIYWEKLEVK